MKSVKNINARLERLVDFYKKYLFLTVSIIKNEFDEIKNFELSLITKELENYNIKVVDSFAYINSVEDFANEIETDIEFIDFTNSAVFEDSIKHAHESSNDPIKSFLNEIGKIRLLTLSEEYLLSKAIQDSKYAKFIFDNKQKYKPTKEEREKFKELINKAEYAKSILIESNLRLVVHISKKYLGRGLEFSDLIQEGCLGLIKSVNKYDPNKGFRFATYATWWIKQSINRAVAEQTRLIRIPVHLHEMINRIYKAINVLTLEYEREPTSLEISTYLEIPEEKIIYLLELSQDTRKLEEQIGEDDLVLADYIPDNKELSPYEYALKEENLEKLDRILHTLSTREEKIIRMRFGLDNKAPMTLDEIGKEFGITRERIRQIESKALKKLKRLIRSINKNYEK